jgi:hypothetical protein
MAPSLVDLNTALDAKWPILTAVRSRLLRRLGIGWAIGIPIAILAGWAIADNDPIFWVFAACLGLISVFTTHRLLRDHGSRTLMPVLTELADFTYTKSLDDVVELKQEGLLPAENTTRIEGVIKGQIGSYSFAFAELSVLKVRTRYKFRTGFRNSTKETRSRRIFYGVVITINALGGISNMLVVRHSLSRASRSVRRHMKNQHQPKPIRQSKSPNGSRYLIFGDQQGNGNLLQKLWTLEAILPKGVKFFSALQRNDQVAIALELRRDLFALGGLLMTKPSVVRQMDQVLQDLTLPLKTLSILVEGSDQSASATGNT